MQKQIKYVVHEARQKRHAQRTDKHPIHQAKLWACIALLCMAAANGYGQSLHMVAMVDDQHIEEAEVKREMVRCRALVMDRFIKTYQLQHLQHFWEKDFNGDKPLAVLRKKALDTLIYIKVQESLFKEYGLWPYHSRAALLEDMEEVNAIRTNMAAAGEVIYGPILFSETSFFDYHFSHATIKAKAKLKQGRFAIYDSTLSDIDQEYEKLVKEKIQQARITVNHSHLAAINF